MIERLVDPASIGIIGVSNDPGKLSGRLLLNLRRHGYRGKVYPINPARTELQGERCWSSIGSVGEPVDLVMIATPAERVADAMAEAIACGNRTFAIYAAGFAELNEEGARHQARLEALAQEHDCLLLGPNCAGFMNAHSSLCGSFSTIADQRELLPGPLSFAGQSGAMGAYWLDAVIGAGLGFAKWLSVGNEAGVDLATAVESLVEDPQTEIICLYIEGTRDGARLCSALRRAAVAGKPVLALRSGRTAAGASAAASHTGAMASENAVWEAVLEQEGALDCASIGEMVDVARFLRTRPSYAATRPMIMSVSGGAGALIADGASQAGMAIRAMPPELKEELRAVLPDFGELHNPLDLTGAVAVAPRLFEKAVQAIARHGEYDSFILFFGLMKEAMEDVLAIVQRELAHLGKPVALVWMGATHEMRERLDASGLAIYADIPEAIRAIAGANRLIESRNEARAAQLDDFGPATRSGGISLSEFHGQKALGQLAIRWPDGRLMQAADAVLPRLPDAVRYVAKLQSGKLLHKSEHGALKLGLAAEQVAQAVSELFVTGKALGVTVDGVLVQSMVAHEHELLVGLRCDPQFGPLLVLGRGGTETEFEHDVALQLLPLTADDITRQLSGLRYFQRLLGVRGRAAIDITALAFALAELCELYLARPDIAEIEINPLGLQPPSEFTALDLVVTLAEQDP